MCVCIMRMIVWERNSYIFDIIMGIDFLVDGLIMGRIKPKFDKDKFFGSSYMHIYGFCSYFSAQTKN